MKKLITGGTAPTEQQIQAVLTAGDTKSQTMKNLFDLGLEVKDITSIISKHLGESIRYNFVYNVVSNYCNMNGFATVASPNARGVVKQQIIDMYLAGKTNKEICIDLKTNANYVFNVLKVYKQQNPVKVADIEVETHLQAEEPKEAAQ